MSKYLWILIFSFVFSAMTFAQSGRRIKALPKPVPTTKVGDQYSESRSYKPLRIYPPNYRKKKTKKKIMGKTEVGLGTKDENGEDIINIDSTLVTIPVSIHSKNGLYISDVRREEVKIFEDGKEQEIAFFRTSEKPFTVALLIDTSPSTEYQIGEIRRAAKAFVDQLKPQDQVLVMEFDGDPQVLSEVTTNRQKIYRAIDKADFGSGTSLYDAVDFAMNKRLNKIKGRKAIVLFTDGVDTVSKRSYDSTMRDVEEADTIIFPIYYNTFLGNQRNGGVIGSPFPRIGTRRNTGNGTSAEEYAVGKKYLEDLAAYTGGRVYRPQRTTGGLTRAFEAIAEELRRQYNVGYYPEKEGEIGQRKKIKVRVYRPKLVIRARDNYIVGANP